MDNLGLKLDKDIFVLGNIPEDMIVDLYNAGDVFLFPSIKEGWGLVVLEAMASGLPVIASDIEPLTEFLEDGNNSLLKLVSGGKKTAEKYSWEATAESHLAIYNDILNNTGLLTSVADKGFP